MTGQTSSYVRDDRADTPQRNGAIDVARFIGAIAIIWFHLPLPGATTALAALHLFIVFQVMFGVTRPIGSQIRRLMVPWLFWSAFYAAASIAQARLQNRLISSEFEPWMILTGASLHLWYLPFSVAAIWVGAHLIRHLGPRALIVLSVAAALACAALANLWDLGVPWAQYVSVGILLAVDFDWRRVIIGAVLGATLVMLATGWSATLYQSALAVFVVGLAFAFPRAPHLVTNWMGQVSFGSYLIHPAVYAVLLMIAPLEGWLMFSAVFALSLLVTQLMRRVAPWSV